jgi:hypothetical protein
MSRHGTPMIKKLSYGSNVYKTFYDTLIEDDLTDFHTFFSLPNSSL